MRHSINRISTPKRSTISPMNVLTHFLVGLTAFQAGLILSGKHTSGTNCNCPSALSSPEAESAQADCSTGSSSSSSFNGFPQSVSGLAKSASIVGRDDFTSHMDLGFPWDDASTGSSDILILHSGSGSAPSARTSDHVGGIPKFTAAQATENCQLLKLILHNPKESGQCFAFVGQYESYHIHKLMRLPEGASGRSSQLSKAHDLRMVPRGTKTNGGGPSIPTISEQETFYAVLNDYLRKLKSTTDRLGPIAKKAAGDGNAIVVLVCNYGQSELLVNFVCSARAQGLDISRILLFATDKDIVDIAVGLGIAVFEVEDAFGEMPKTAAHHYGDKSFTGMMMAKIYCVHLVNTLGYDLLFQDVDVVWRHDPLEFFESDAAGDFDIYFQDDGARTPRYAPYSPNTGFYFVRHNERTAYFFSVFVRMGDLVQVSGSHQSALNNLLSEHASWRGLKVKVYGRDDEDGHKFPGGFHYHNRRDYMKHVATGEEDPFIFHMSWTKNKENKRLFFQQMGYWFVQDKCVAKRASEIQGNYAEECCAAEAIVKCHYRDKPSKIPCKESDPIDKGRKSFW